ncbi:MAG: haloacid dehalogenase type II [Betaproteobacteria bacterium]|nr:haloacid dehalogenase type II [Betaproteobacteria bacterium]
MISSRREFLQIASATVAAGMLAADAHAVPAGKIKAIAFDAFPIFDPRPVFALAEQLFPGKGAELGNAWRTRQFEYQWLRALAGSYADFLRTTEDALIFSCELLKLDLTTDKRRQLVDAYLALKAWPDALPAVNALKNAGLRLAFLSNATPQMLEAGIRNAGLEGLFEHVLSTDAIRTYKPDPRAYRLAIDAFGLKREEILFAAFAGWDAAGAKTFGYPTFWVNRMNLPAERLGVAADASGQGLNDLVTYVKTSG